MRRLAYLSLALVLNLALFQFMAGLIARHRLVLKPILHAHSIDFVRLPQREDPPPERQLRRPPPPPAPPKAPVAPASPQATAANVRELPTPELALKVEVPMAASVKLAAPSLPSLLVEGEPAAVPGPVHVPTSLPGYILASELVAVVRTPPLYPPEARSRRIEGRVVVEFTVTERGEVQDPVIIEASPPGVFDQAVLQSVRGWRFKPKEKDGRPIAVRARQPLEFKLRQ
ncbi:MAG: TonB family protein [Methylohalobius sp.]|nr:TonB family protein [Methylohalobius sp.]